MSKLTDISFQLVNSRVALVSRRETPNVRAVVLNLFQVRERFWLYEKFAERQN